MTKSTSGRAYRGKRDMRGYGRGFSRHHRQGVDALNILLASSFEYLIAVELLMVMVLGLMHLLLLIHLLLLDVVRRGEMRWDPVSRRRRRGCHYRKRKTVSQASERKKKVEQDSFRLTWRDGTAKKGGARGERLSASRGPLPPCAALFPRSFPPSESTSRIAVSAGAGETHRRRKQGLLQRGEKNHSSRSTVGCRFFFSRSAAAVKGRSHLDFSLSRGSPVNARCMCGTESSNRFLGHKEESAGTIQHFLDALLHPKSHLG